MSKIHHMVGNIEGGKHVVFIHGLGGNFRTTWMGGINKKEFWPEWLLEQGGDACIWSVEYESKVAYFIDDAMAFKDRAANIAENLFIKKELLNGKVIFIGHSMGGLIIKQIIRLANDQKNINEAAEDLISRITGVGFIGTPHTGSDLSTLGNMLPVRLAMSLLKCSPSAATLYLYRNNPDLRELNQWFREWDRQNNVSILSLGEGKKTGFKGWIVKPDSADAGLSTRLKVVDKDHNSICKPEDREDEVYNLIEHFVFEDKAEPQTLWLRVNAGKLNSGWSGYSNWAGQKENNAYIVDEKVKFTDKSINTGEKLTTLDVIDSVRNRLARPGASVRLVGLSGVGKTRFAQALFDSEVGQNALSHDTVFYTDTAHSPNPTPAALIEKLIGSGLRAVLIIDNCAWDLHRTLTEQLGRALGRVSLLTIEYDIREDIPANTDVITMEAGSQELITTLIKKNYSHIGSNSVHKIAEFSGGNARVAIALASAVGRDDDISQLKDRELFSRLFNQRHAADAELQKSAEVLSLVYSFQLEADEGNSEELECLSRLSGINYENLLRSAKELKRRGLAQTRHIWMAVLPHPVANWLAQMALENISPANITAHINPRKSPRMFSSFTRRLGFLSSSTEARSYVANLLAPDGSFEIYISDLPIAKKSEYTQCFMLISNIAPIAQSETLDFLGRMAEKDCTFFTRENPAFIPITRLLRSLAYESKYFEVSASMLYLLALSENKGENKNSVLQILSSLFLAYLSGTHSTLDQRINFIRQHSGRERIDITFKLLEMMLQSSHFTSHYGFDFGASVRDYGYHPGSVEECEKWYLTTLELIQEMLYDYPEFSREISTVITSNLRGLWSLELASVRNELSMLLSRLLPLKGGYGIWNAVCTALKFDAAEMSEEARNQLSELKEIARPDTFEKKLEIYIFSGEHGFYGLDEENKDGETVRYGYEVVLESVATLANELALTTPEFIEATVIKLLTEKGDAWRITVFAERLLTMLQDKKNVFVQIEKYIEKFGTETLNVSFICGALSGLAKTDSLLVNNILDGYSENPTLEKIFPALQIAVPLDETGTDRIKKHLLKDGLDVSGYCNLATGRRHELITDEVLCEILTLLLRHKNGEICVLEILSMRFHSEREEKYSPDGNLIEFSRNYIIKLLNDENINFNHIRNYHFETIAQRAFRDSADEELTKLLDTVIIRSEGLGIYDTELPLLIKIVIKNSPLLFLENLYSEKNNFNASFFEALKHIFYSERLEANILPASAVIDWAHNFPDICFKLIAQLVVPYVDLEGKISWTELSRTVLEETSDVDIVLGVMVKHFTPRSWIGSRAEKMEEKRHLLVELLSSDRCEISKSARRHLDTYDRYIANVKESELKEFREQDERFE